MAAIEVYRELKQRKQALLVESDLNRLVLRLELERLRTSATRMDSTLSTVRRVGPWLLPIASLVGIVAGGRAVKAGSKGGWMRLALRAAPLLLGILSSRGAKGRPD